MKNLILIHGENTFKSKNFLKEITSKLHGVEIENYEGQDIIIQNFASDLHSLPFLADKRIIILEDFFKHAEKEEIEKFIPCLNKIPDFLTLIILETKAFDKRLSAFKFFKKNAEIFDASPLEAKEVLPWLRSYIKDNSITCEISFPDFLIKQSGTISEIRLINELKKLQTYALNTPLTKEMAKNLIPKALTLNIFNLTEALSNKNPVLAITILHEMTDSGETPFQIFSMIVRQFRILIMVKELSQKGMNEFDIAKKISLHPYPTKLAIPQTKNFTYEKLKEIYKTLLEIDIASKSGDIKISTTDTSEMTLALEQLIFKFCNRD